MLAMRAGVVCFLNLVVASAPATDNDDCKQWLRDHVVELRSIDPAEQAVDDLIPVLKAIGKHRIVAFSGGGGADRGASYRAMTRLIRVLHDRRKFERLVWGVGLFEATHMEARLAAHASLDDAARTLFAVWRTSDEIHGLLRYARETHAEEDPLRMLGSLSQYHAAGKAFYPAHLIAQFDAIDSSLLTEQHRKDLDRIFIGHRRLSRAPRAIRKEGATLVASLIEIFQENRVAFDQALGAERTALEWRMLHNLRTFIELENIRAKTSDHPLNAEEFRNLAQRDNLAWLINEQFPSRRLILWPGHERMLDVTEADVYVIGFTSYAGTIGRSNQTQHTTLPPPPPDSLEALLHGLGVQVGFVDLDEVQADPNHLLRRCPPKQSFTNAIPTEHRLDVLDGLIFIDEMTPCTPVD